MKGYYVIWKGDLYIAKTDISSGTTLSAASNGNLTAKPSGLGADVAALNSKLTLTNASASSDMTVISGGTAESVIPSLSASYAKIGPLVHLSFLFWGGTIDGANSNQLLLKLPMRASSKTLRYYGHIGYSSAGITDFYVLINSQNDSTNQQLAFVRRNATNGNEEAVSGAQVSGKTIQGDIWYFSE